MLAPVLVQICLRALAVFSTEGQTQVKQKTYCISRASKKAQLCQLEMPARSGALVYCSGFISFSDRALKHAPAMQVPSLSVLSWEPTPDALEIIITTIYPGPDNRHSKCTFLIPCSLSILTCLFVQSDSLCRHSLGGGPQQMLADMRTPAAVSS